MSWDAIVPNLITGVVGVAGIAGSILAAHQARKSAAENLRTGISAEDRRAKVAEKRRIYAACLTALNNMMTAQADYGVDIANAKSKAERRVAYSELVPVRNSLLNAVSELELVAPETLGRLARERFQWHMDRIKEVGQGEKMNLKNRPPTHWDILAAMRTDLGDPAWGNREPS